ncbi:Conserved_hypothetical protein [Hexamita inflata]|uniref:Uncharacterized protein n=1 Tax=Hexamita inflata TaxID=28002 RepID=A0AA86TFS1_9EUKA|nr:Conserved hypothetical protein [Hexamita inflata]
MLLYFQSQALQIFAISEFEFCYNYVFYEPFQQHMNIVLAEPLTFDGSQVRDLCTRSENVLFRQVNVTQVEFTLDFEVNLNSQPFSLFFFSFQDLTVVNSEVNIRLTNGGSDVSLFVATIPEYPVRILDCRVKATSTTVKQFYGVANNFTEPLVVNRSAFEYSFQNADGFYGIARQTAQLTVQNSSFKFAVSAKESCGLASVLGASTFTNISVSGTLAGLSTFGLAFESRALVTTANITYALVSSGSSANCGFIQVISGSSQVKNSNLTFVGYAGVPSEPSSYGSGVQCPCITGAALQSGLCYCAAGARPLADNCSCFTPNAIIKSLVCVCGVNATNTSNVCVCPIGSSLVNGVCVCAVTNAFPVNGACVCGTNATLSNNVCACPSGSLLQNGICKCQTANAFPENGACRCGTNATNSSNSCNCPGGSLLQNAICKCQTANAFPVNGNCACATSASNNSNVCVCPSYSTVQSGACKCDPSYSTMQNNNCVCTPKASWMSNGVCVCPVGAVIQSDTCKCTTPGSSLKDNVCKCTSDYAWGAWANDGNAWCYNLKLCCSKCLWKTGDNWGCSDDKYHKCSKNNDIVAA